MRYWKKFVRTQPASLPSSTTPSASRNFPSGAPLPFIIPILNSPSSSTPGSLPRSFVGRGHVVPNARPRLVQTLVFNEPPDACPWTGSSSSLTKSAPHDPKVFSGSSEGNWETVEAPGDASDPRARVRAWSRLRRISYEGCKFYFPDLCNPEEQSLPHALLCCIKLVFDFGMRRERLRRLEGKEALPSDARTFWMRERSSLRDWMKLTQ